MMDVYLEPAYGQLYESIEGGICETFMFSSKEGVVYNMFIKRPVPWLVEGVQYYDVVTPYGYGGPIIEQCNGDKDNLARRFGEAFQEYCRQNHIAAEFVRFHPLLGNARDFSTVYAPCISRNTVAINLEDAEYRNNQYTSNCRNELRKAIRKGVVLQVDHRCERLDQFMQLYNLTMKKNQASDYYFFSTEYFHKLKNLSCLKTILIHAYVEGVLISSALFLAGERYLHYHLSATHPEYYGYGANNLILDKAVAYGRVCKLSWLHLGGGLSADQSDTLLRFKMRFGKTEKNIKQFFLGKKVYLKGVYDQLTKMRTEKGSPVKEGYFPQYRG